MSTTPAETEVVDTPSSDGPLLDLTDAGVKKFIKQAKARGYVTMDELNKVLPSEEVTSESSILKPNTGATAALPALSMVPLPRTNENRPCHFPTPLRCGCRPAPVPPRRWLPRLA